MYLDGYLDSGSFFDATDPSWTSYLQFQIQMENYFKTISPQEVNPFPAASELLSSSVEAPVAVGRERKEKRSYKYKVAALKAANAALLQPLKQIHNTISQEEKEENISEGFIMLVKRVRIRLGFTQSDLGSSLGAMYGKQFSQTTICRFESRQLSSSNMKRLVPLLKRWVDDAETNPAQVIQKTNEEVIKKTKKRDVSEPDVAAILEKQFLKNSKPTAAQLSVMARSLDLDKEALRNWYTRQKSNSITLA
ncbi:Oidioi.mRNA.OKI2018_I69.XSR.g16089.t1.cds [Oikopleura dioica]|uniref:Oidioi.mRNA.OKI2018_I69.XSR.g16089.t1.cds n=1 Tax=Oikopleura dioica TaxID=34765 RepID=A0ABN7SK29_OIKDI|nr:Oidioi.mRNA.OKI2018_I69.XSR.g16089.t1.cds [Oikopleura dioica]